MKYKKIGDICSVITDYVANGSFSSLKQNVEYQQHGYAAVIRLKDYRNNFNGPFEYVSKRSYEFLKKTKLMGGEIIISNVGANIGTVFKVPNLKCGMTLGPNSIMIKTKYVDDYYYYLLKSNYGQSLINSIVSGSAQPKFNKTDFKKLEVPVPTLEEQKEIVGHLTTIDNKIHKNNQINDNLVA
ncbi:restriction endonuclease subunit S [Limosilactobacillus reuteri]|uniref:Type I R/M system specificity subunit n=1 Tax=Limosilactobacillus reuteri TaxID=1598 RepID=A0AB36AE82_LIMRT|nr:restriction endonuclease subunit S [Limosilactobacillus reuteri]MRG83439.1 type I R/M system specificity subunit [Limosilactobacillus reuteri]